MTTFFYVGLGIAVTLLMFALIGSRSYGALGKPALAERMPSWRRVLTLLGVVAAVVFVIMLLTNRSSSPTPQHSPQQHRQSSYDWTREVYLEPGEKSDVFYVSPRKGTGALWMLEGKILSESCVKLFVNGELLHELDCPGKYLPLDVILDGPGKIETLQYEALPDAAVRLQLSARRIG